MRFGVVGPVAGYGGLKRLEDRAAIRAGPAQRG
jgi:hypothetical protein